MSPGSHVSTQDFKPDVIMADIPAREEGPILAMSPSIVTERRAYPATDIFIGDFYLPQNSRPDLPRHNCLGEEYHTYTRIDPQLYLSEADGPTTLAIISSDDPSNQHQARVHFRSRVRITSGINHHRHRLSSSGDSEGLRSSRSSSLSGSSSISVPLRSHVDEQTATPGWGTLGQRVSLFAKGKGPSRRQRRRNQREQEFLSSKPKKQRRRSLGSHSNGSFHDERTPLNSANTRMYIHGSSNNQDSDDEEELDYQKEIELVFGAWPLRLLNHHWWWWKLEPVFCCRHTADSDEEG